MLKRIRDVLSVISEDLHGDTNLLHKPGLRPGIWKFWPYLSYGVFVSKGNVCAWACVCVCVYVCTVLYNMPPALPFHMVLFSIPSDIDH